MKVHISGLTIQQNMVMGSRFNKNELSIKLTMLYNRVHNSLMNFEQSMGQDKIGHKFEQEGHPLRQNNC